MAGKVVIVVVVLFGFLSPKRAWAEKVILLTEHLAPFQVVDGDKVTGLATQIVTKTFDAADIDFSIEAYPWAIAYNRSLREIDTCIYSIGRIPDREANFRWIGRISTIPTAFYSLATSSLMLSNLDQAKSYVTAVLKEDLAHHFLTSKGFIVGGNLVLVENYDALLNLLEMTSRKVDFIVISDLLISHRLGTSDWQEKYRRQLDIRDLEFDFYLACHRHMDKQLVAKLKRHMQQLDAEGAFQPMRQVLEGTKP